MLEAEKKLQEQAWGSESIGLSKGQWSPSIVASLEPKAAQLREQRREKQQKRQGVPGEAGEARKQRHLRKKQNDKLKVLQAAGVSGLTGVIDGNLSTTTASVALRNQAKTGR